MVGRRKPIVTELALADALEQLVNLIGELRADASLRVEITTDETDLVKLIFSGTPDVGFAIAAGGTGYSYRDRSPRLERGPPRLRDRVALWRRRLSRDPVPLTDDGRHETTHRGDPFGPGNDPGAASVGA